MGDATRKFPVHSGLRNGQQSTIPEPVHMRAYEVYCELWGPQEALIDLEGRNCRGGFTIDEVVALLYVASFPKSEWKRRYFDEAIDVDI